MEESALVSRLCDFHIGIQSTHRKNLCKHSSLFSSGPYFLFHSIEIGVVVACLFSLVLHSNRINTGIRIYIFNCFFSFSLAFLFAESPDLLHCFQISFAIESSVSDSHWISECIFVNMRLYSIWKLRWILFVIRFPLARAIACFLEWKNFLRKSCSEIL